MRTVSCLTGRVNYLRTKDQDLKRTLLKQNYAKLRKTTQNYIKILFLRTEVVNLKRD